MTVLASAGLRVLVCSAGQFEGPFTPVGQVGDRQVMRVLGFVDWERAFPAVESL